MKISRHFGVHITQTICIFSQLLGTHLRNARRGAPAQIFQFSMSRRRGVVFIPKFMPFIP